MNYDDQFERTTCDLDDLDELYIPEQIDWNNDQVEGFTLDAIDTTNW